MSFRLIVAALVTASCLMLVVFIGDSALSGYKVQSGVGTQVLDTDLAGNTFTDEQKEAVHFAVSEGYSVKAVPVVVENQEHFVVVLGTALAKSESALEALELVAEKFPLAGIDGLKVRDVILLKPSWKNIFVRLDLAVKSLFSSPDSFEASKRSIESEHIYKAADQLIVGDGPARALNKNAGQKNHVLSTAVWLEEGQLTPGPGARMNRMAFNVRRAFSKMRNEKFMLVVVDHSQMDALANSLRSQNPADYVLQSLRAK
jgi:hypothetical protein